MSDDKQKGTFRRVGRKDQKEEIKSDQPLIPDDDSKDFIASETNDEETAQSITLDDLDALVEANKDNIGDVDARSSDVETPSDEEPWVAPPAEKRKRPKPESPPKPREKERYPPIAVETPRPAAATTPKAQPEPVSKSKRRRRVGNWRHDVVALLFVIGTLGLIWYFSLIWRNPYSSLNPLAKPTPFVYVSVTPDPEALAHFFATQTAESAAPVSVYDATPIPSSSIFAFGVSNSGVLYSPNANGSGCDWASIAGTVTNLQGEPLNSYRIHVVDAEDPDRLDVNVFSGSALTFGAGGFELPLGGTPLVGQYRVQLLSPGGAPLSDEITISTRDTCEENVAIINFEQIREL